MPPRHYQVSIIRNETGITALQGEWNLLYKRAQNPYLSQSFEWAWAAWQTIAKPRGQRPCFVIIRSDHRVVLIWPMVLSTRNLFWLVASPLGTTEYNDILVEACEEKFGLAVLAWQALQKNSGAALIRAERVRRDSVLAEVLDKQRVERVHLGMIRYVAWDRCDDWDSYWSRRTSKFRRELERRRRRLSELGEVSFQVGTEVESQREIATWMLHMKTDWLLRNKASSSWVGTKEYADFFTSVSGRIKTFGEVRTFAMSLNGKVIAAELNQVTNSKLEAMNFAYDAQYARYSPGTLLLKFTLEWAHQHNLLVDLRMGEEKYKELFATRTDAFAHYIVVNNLWGKMHEHCRKVCNQVKIWPKTFTGSGVKKWRVLKKARRA